MAMALGHFRVATTGFNILIVRSSQFCVFSIQLQTHPQTREEGQKAAVTVLNSQ